MLLCFLAGLSRNSVGQVSNLLLVLRYIGLGGCSSQAGGFRKSVDVLGIEELRSWLERCEDGG
jgi:hypothetical protein